MTSSENVWAVVLAGGDGTRLLSLTTDIAGRPTPKQYCSLFGGTTLVQDALRRGRAVAGRDRVCAIVAVQHAEWWRGPLWALNTGNLIAQPRNRGTANGVLLSLLSILARDPNARVVFLPADHYVAHEGLLAFAMRAAVAELERAPEELVLVGIEPDRPDPELGYVLPGAVAGRAHRVVRFVEKPALPLAVNLVAAGALWNTFIFAAAGATLLGLLRAAMPDAVDRMETALARCGSCQPDAAALEALYAQLPHRDFSQHVLAGAVERLRVIGAPACGWTDLGSPRRVAEAVLRAGRTALPRPRPNDEDPVPTLASAYRRPRRQTLRSPRADVRG